jgi:hypothetical protein
MANPVTDADKIGEIGPILARTRPIRKHVRLLRLGIVLLVFLIIGLWTWSIVSHIKHFDTVKFGDEVAKRAESTWPLVADELNLLVNTLIPMAEASLEKELEAAGPEVEKKFNTEARLLEDNVKADIEKSLKAHLSSQLRGSASQEINAAFPGTLTPEAVDQLATKLQESFVMATQQRLLGMLTSYYDTVLKFNSAFKNLRSKTPEGAKPPTLETVLGLWTELVYEKMGGDSQLEIEKPKGK